MIKIQEQDILWNFYLKRFKIEGIAVEKPTNLCSYFWMSMWGAFLSFWAEVSLWLVWLLVGCWFATSVWLSSLAIPNILVFTSLMLSSLFIVGAVIATAVRVVPYIKMPKWLKWLGLTCFFVFCGGGLSAVFVAMILSLYPQMPHTGVLGYTEAAGSFLGVGLGFLAGSAAIVGLVYLIGVFILKPMSGWRFIQQCWMMLQAWKKRMCPLVEAPDSFLPKAEDNEAASGDSTTLEQ